MTTNMTSLTAAVPARGRKFDQVRDGATVIFLRDGYAAASVDDIARSARVSKATLYSYFPEKSLMFREAMRAERERAFRQPPFGAAPHGTVKTALPKALSDLALWLGAESRLRLLRVITAEATRFPEDAKAYDQAMSHTVVMPLARLIDGWTASGHLRPHDSDGSAHQLVALVAGQIQQPALLTGTAPSGDRIARIATSAAGLFLSAHALSDAA